MPPVRRSNRASKPGAYQYPLNTRRQQPEFIIYTEPLNLSSQSLNNPNIQPHEGLNTGLNTGLNHDEGLVSSDNEGLDSSDDEGSSDNEGLHLSNNEDLAEDLAENLAENLTEGLTEDLTEDLAKDLIAQFCDEIEREDLD